MADPSTNVAQRATVVARSPRDVTVSTGPDRHRSHTSAPVQTRTVTWIPTAAVQDCELSYRASGLLAYLLSFPDDHEHDVPSIVAAGPDGREAVRTTLAELEAAGYLAWRTVRTPQPNGGTLTRRVFDIYDTRGAAPPSEGLPRRAPAIEWQPGEQLAGDFADLSAVPADGFAVYRLHGHDGHLLYIGRTTHPRARLKAHLGIRGPELLARWEMVACPTHVEMCELEVELIDHHRPPLNRGAAA
jgi:hypothetical protein